MRDVRRVKDAHRGDIEIRCSVCGLYRRHVVANRVCWSCVRHVNPEKLIEGGEY